MNTPPKIRHIVLYKHYFKDFFREQMQATKDKITWTLRLIETQQRIPEEYLKHIEGTNGLYEIRVQRSTEAIRIFCFFDEGKVIVLANGFQKKSQKTPQQEINKALKIKQEYEQET
jgi:phage-related protein